MVSSSASLGWKQPLRYVVILDANTTAMVAIGVAAASEIIGLSPLRSNSVIQLLLQGLRMIFPKR